MTRKEKDQVLGDRCPSYSTPKMSSVLSRRPGGRSTRRSHFSPKSPETQLAKHETASQPSSCCSLTNQKESDQHQHHVNPQPRRRMLTDEFLTKLPTRRKCSMKLSSVLLWNLKEALDNLLNLWRNR